MLRDLLRKSGILVASAVYDALSARICERAGFELVEVSGYCVSGSFLGMTDVDLLTMQDMVTVVKNIAGAVSIPVMVDADTGYGNAINAARAVKEFERAGAPGIMIEDQVAPKKCPFIGSQPLISEKEMLGKIRATLDARSSEALIKRARTDARGQEAIERANSYADAGAEMIHAVQRSVEDVEGFPKLVHAPLSIAVMGWKQSCTVEELKRRGYKAAIFVASMYSVTKALVDFMAVVKNTGTVKGLEDKMVSMEHYEKLVDLSARFSFRVFESKISYELRGAHVIKNAARAKLC